MEKEMTEPYNVRNEVDTRNPLHKNTERPRCINMWDDEYDDDEELDDCHCGLDPAFDSWEEVNGMFFSK